MAGPLHAAGAEPAAPCRGSRPSILHPRAPGGPRRAAAAGRLPGIARTGGQEPAARAEPVLVPLEVPRKQVTVRSPSSQLLACG